MKIAYKHLLKYFQSNPSISEMSDKLFQLGHEHEIENNIFNFEFTPNRGDCLSLDGLSRDLALFYDPLESLKVYDKNIDRLELDFVNNAINHCPRISFLRVDIKNQITEYKSYLHDYFDDLDVKKNNFFTDISNYISYETGQPTHCYDANNISNSISLETINQESEFETLLDKKIKLKDKNLVFISNKKIINLAGIVGGKESSCSNKTTSVIIECAYFFPEQILGKSVKYDIQSDAAHKFERGVDPCCHERVLRRFLKIIEEHAEITNVELFSKDYNEYEETLISCNLDAINKILGVNLSQEDFKKYLLRLGFLFKDNYIKVPSYRSDVKTQNDIAEEIARALGYDNIPALSFDIPSNEIKKIPDLEKNTKSFLIDNGFQEVINNPFVGTSKKYSVKVDNPLDSNRQFLRTTLKSSLLNNLFYNERRQNDSIKLFEISDIYLSSKKNEQKRFVGIIASGRVGKNYETFTKTINLNYFKSFLNKLVTLESIKIEEIPRELSDSKLKNPIIYVEFETSEIYKDISKYEAISKLPNNFIKYKKISELPSSVRDLSFSIKDYKKLNILEEKIMNYSNEILKECFIFDYFKNDKANEIKIAFRFVFQSIDHTITENEVNAVINDIINISLKIKSVSIPGLKK